MENLEAEDEKDEPNMKLTMGDFKWFLNLFENEILPGSHARIQPPSLRAHLTGSVGYCSQNAWVRSWSRWPDLVRSKSAEFTMNLPYVVTNLGHTWAEKVHGDALRFATQHFETMLVPQRAALSRQLWPLCHRFWQMYTCCDHILLLVVARRCWSLLVVSRFGLFATGAVSDYKFFLCGARWSIRGGRWVAVNAPRTNVAGSHWGQHWEILRAWISVEMVRSDMLGPLDSSGLQSLASYVEGSLGCMRLTCRSPCALLRVLVLRFGSWDGFDFWRFLVNGKMPKRVTFCFRSYLMAIRPPSAIVASICQVVSIVASCGIMWHPTIAFCTASQVAKSSEWHWPVLSMRIQSGAQICWGCYRFLPTGFTMFPSCSRHQGHLHFGRFNLSAVVT